MSKKVDAPSVDSRCFVDHDAYGLCLTDAI